MSFYLFLLFGSSSAFELLVSGSQQRRSELSILYDKNDALSDKTNNIKSSIKKDRKKVFSDMGKVKNILADLRSRNDKLIAKIELVALRSNLLKLGLFIIAITIFIMWIWQELRKKSMDKMNYVKNNKAVSDLIEIIISQNEPKKARLYAIKKLYNEIPSVTKQEVILIKFKIKELSKSPLKENIKVAAQLRIVAVALEQRLREQEQIK